MPVVDEYTRECLSIDVERSITAEDVVETLASLFRRRGEPSFIRSDNGPEFVAKAIKQWLGWKHQGLRPSTSSQDLPGRTLTNARMWQEELPFYSGPATRLYSRDWPPRASGGSNVKHAIAAKMCRLADAQCYDGVDP
jgi:transposase InsO family protein